MSIVVPNRRLAQPVIGPSPIPGCRALFDMRWGVDLINGQLASANTGTRIAGTGGQAFDFSGTANVQFAGHPNYAITGAVAALALLDVDALTGYGPIVSKINTSTAAIPYEMRIGNGATTAEVSFTRATTGGSWRGHHTGSNRITAATTRQMVGVRSTAGTIETVPTAFVNGAFYTMSTVGGSGTGTAGDSGAASAVWIGRRADGATQLDGRIYWVALFDRWPDDDEILAIWVNPSILFPTQPRRSRVGAAGAPPSGFLPAWIRRRSQVIGAGVH